MTLREWMRTTRTSVQAVADATGVSAASVYGWMKGTFDPSFTAMVALERLTDGKVRASTLREPKQ